MQTNLKSEKRLGFPGTVKGHALIGKYADELAGIINDERTTRHGNKATEIWDALAKFSDENLAINILALALQANHEDLIGKWYSHIGTQLGFRGALAVKIGMWAVDLLRQLPIVKDVLPDGGLVLDLDSDGTQELISGAIEHAVRSRPLLMPLQEPPVWAPAGEHADEIWPGLAIVSHHPSVMRACADAFDSGRAQPAIDAVNWLQGTPFTINKPVLSLLQNEPAPQQPLKQPPAWWGAPRKATSDEQKKLFAGQRAYYKKWAAAESASYSWRWMLQEFTVLADWPAFFNPLKLEFRGRVNAIPQFAFQREDAIRAQFLFARSAPIGHDGIQQLKAHVAARANGCAWADDQKPERQSREGRIAFTDRNEKHIRRIGETILAGRALRTDDLPDSKERYQFAAACVELAQALDVGPTFETRLPLVSDASCSGLQHIAMMMRSGDGRYANLIPDDVPADFYQVVADRVRDTTDLLNDIPSIHHRAIVKRPVMTFFYGVTDRGMSDQIFEKLKDLRLNQYELSHEKSRAIAKAVSNAIEELATSTKQVRAFLEGIAGAYAASNKVMHWDTPLGLPILNAYHKMKFERVSYPVNGKRRLVKWCTGNTDDVRPGKAKRSVTANFIHSCDAALLHAVALAAKAEGIEIVTVHDCFGTIAPHARRLNEILREQLIELHTKHDWLKAVYDTARQELPDATLPEIPQRGKLDPNLVRDSFFAFN